MLDFGTSFLGWLAATAIPAFLGLLLITGAGKWVKGKYLAAFAIGIFMWFFVDTIGGSANLDVNAGFGGGIDQVAMGGPLRRRSAVVLFRQQQSLFFGLPIGQHEPYYPNIGGFGCGNTRFRRGNRIWFHRFLHA